VTDGIVEIFSLPVETAVNQAKELTGVPPTRVSAGESAIIEGLEAHILPIEIEEIDVRLAWKRGQLVFQGDSLEYVVAEVSRYTDQSIAIVDDTIRDMRIGGRFEAGDVENLLDILQYGFNVEVTRFDEGQIHLASRGPVDD